MKQPKLKYRISDHACGFVERKTVPRNEPSFKVAVAHGVYSFWLGKQWCAVLHYLHAAYEPDIMHIMECPRTNLLMCNDGNANGWEAFAKPIQDAYREYKATWELEEAMLNTK